MPRVAVEHLRAGDTVQFLNGTYQIDASEPRSSSFRSEGWWFFSLVGWTYNNVDPAPVHPTNVLSIPDAYTGCYEAPNGTLLTVVTLAPREDPRGCEPCLV